MLGRHHRLQEARLAERLDSCTTGRVDVIVWQRGQRRIGPARQALGETAMAVVEEGRQV
jgi:hypothetical protein